MGTRFARWLLVGAAGLVAALAHVRIPRPEPAQTAELFVPQPDVARVAALGFDALAADYYWLRAVQIVGGSPRDPSQHASVIGRLIDVVTTLDPWVVHPYHFAALWMTDSAENVRTANRLLARAIEHHPEDWLNYFYLAFNYFFYFGENEPAADVLERAISLPGRPAYLPRLVARLRADGAGLDAAEAFLRQLVAEAPDGYARTQYEKALDEIHTERVARLLDQAREAYRRRNGRDIEAVEDLVRGPGRVLSRLPAEPHGWEWELNAETGQIASSYYYGYRYEPLFSPGARRRRSLPEQTPRPEAQVESEGGST